MELKEFIEKVLTDIFVGVANAQSNVADCGGIINPDVYAGANSGVVLTSESYKNKIPCTAEFDVALSAIDKKQTGGHLGVIFGNIGIGGSGSAAAETSQITRVKFTVPYKLP